MTALAVDGSVLDLARIALWVVEQHKLLAAVDAIEGLVDIEQDAPRHLLEARAKEVDHRRHLPQERRLGRQVLQPAHGGLPAELGVGFQQAADRHLGVRVVAQGIAFVGVFLASGNHQGTTADHLGQAMAHLPGRARMLDATGQPIGETAPALDLRQQRHTSVRGHPSTVEGDVYRLAGDG